MDGAEQREKLGKDAALKAAQWKADVEWFMSQAQAKRILAHFIRESRKRPFSTDARITEYNLGRFEFVREFLDQLRDANLGLFQAIERDLHEKKL